LPYILVLAATTRAETLVGPSRVGGKALAAARDFLDGCETIPVGAGVADDAAALTARHGALSLPDAITLVVAELIDADVVLTFDRRWRGLQPRISIP
jgi:predicted nucleic acid-binding protein